MIDRKLLIKHLTKLGINKQGKTYILEIYDKNRPSRKPTGNFLSVHDTIASRKEYWTRNSESRTTELPFLFWCEFSANVISYYCQPDYVTLKRTNKSGKLKSYKKRFDYLVITNTEVTLVECKKVEWLKSAIKKEPEKYSFDNGHYKFPAAESAAKELSFSFRISTDRDLTSQFTRNSIFLFNFIDDIKSHDTTISQKIKEFINDNGNRAKLNHLNKIFGQLNVIKAYYYREIFIDIENELFCYPDNTWVYSNNEYLLAIRNIKQENELFSISHINQIGDSSSLWWNTSKYEILQATLTPEIKIILRDNKDKIITLSEENFNTLIDKQELYIPVTDSAVSQSIKDIISNKKSYQLEEARNRVSIIQNNNDRSNVSKRTLYRWKSKARNKDPYTALLSNKELRGNREPRLQQAVINLMHEYFSKLIIASPPSKYFIWSKFKAECENRGLKYCSYKTFNTRFEKSVDPFKKTLIQKGFKAAYALGVQPREIDLNWELPAHGDFILEIAHIDHTPIEISLVSALNGDVLEGTLNLTIMHDGYSREILAVYITYEKPSYRCTMMLLRECYRRHKRLPLFLAFDHGSDFESTYVDATIADLGINKRRRPTSATRHGSIIERVFGTTESELVHTLKGNKQLQKLGRGLSNTHRSDKEATLTPDQFDNVFKHYAYNVYPESNHRGISDTPSNRWKESLKQFDELPGNKVLSEKGFIISTMPRADRDGKRCLRHGQIEFKKIRYTLTRKIAGYSGQRMRVPIKYDPYNIEHIWAQINERWECLTTTDTLVKECHDKGIQLAHIEIHSRQIRNSRRYNQGAKQSADLHYTSDQKEQHIFNLKQSKLGVEENLNINTPKIENFKVTTSGANILPAETLPKVKDYE